MQCTGASHLATSCTLCELILTTLTLTIASSHHVFFAHALQQVERVLRHRIQHLIGANFEAILTPSSRGKVRQLIGELVAADQAATINPDAEGAISNGGSTAVIPNVKPCSGENGSGNESLGCAREILSDNEVVPMSEQSFPLEVVKVESPSTSAEDNSSLTVEASDAAQVKSDVSSRSSNPRAQAQISSDDSFCSSNDAKNLLKANEALGRNVRWHNENLARQAKDQKKRTSHQDDVTGASVISNNAGARLSSLLHRTESPTDDKEPTRKRKVARMYDGLDDQCCDENASDDSGYRQSSESLREDTFSTSDDSSSLRNGECSVYPKSSGFPRLNLTLRSSRACRTEIKTPCTGVQYLPYQKRPDHHLVRSNVLYPNQLVER